MQVHCFGFTITSETNTVHIIVPLQSGFGLSLLLMGGVKDISFYPQLYNCAAFKQPKEAQDPRWPKESVFTLKFHAKRLDI